MIVGDVASFGISGGFTVTEGCVGIVGGVTVGEDCVGIGGGVTVDEGCVGAAERPITAGGAFSSEEGAAAALAPNLSTCF